MKSRPVGWLVPAVLVAAVIFVYYHVGLNWADIDKRLNPLAALALALTLFIACYVQYHLGSRTAVDRAEKDMVIAVAGDVRILVRQAYDQAFERWLGGSELRQAAAVILAVLRRASNRIDDLREAIDESRILKSSSPGVETVRVKFTALKAALTGHNFPEAAYSPQDVLAHERAYRDFSRSLTAFILEINRKP